MGSSSRSCEDGSFAALCEMPVLVASKKRGKADSTSMARPSKQIKLNSGTKLQVSNLDTGIRGLVNSVPSPSGIRLTLQPRQKIIGLHSGVTKALFCITVSTPPPTAGAVPGNQRGADWRKTVVVKIDSSAHIHKVRHPRADRRGDNTVLVPIKVAKHNHHEDILVQVVDLPCDDLYVKASIKRVKETPAGFRLRSNSVEPIKCFIERPNSDVVSKDAPYVQAQLLLYAATIVLQDFRSQDLENLRRNKKRRVEEVLRMIQNAPESIRDLSVVKELELKLKM